MEQKSKIKYNNAENSIVSFQQDVLQFLPLCVCVCETIFPFRVKLQDFHITVCMNQTATQGKKKKKNSYAFHFTLENILHAKPVKQPQKTQIYCLSQDAHYSLATHSAQGRITTLLCSASSPASTASLLRFGSFLEVRPILCFALWDRVHPGGKPVLYKQLIKWLRWRLE